MRIERLDDLGDLVPLAQPVRRVVSLSPSLTEVVSTLDVNLLVGVTSDVALPPLPGPVLHTAVSPDVAVLGSSRQPDLRLVSRLVPDLVLASKSENRLADVQRLREAGVGVWVTEVETVAQALHSVERLISEGLGSSLPAWWRVAQQRWSKPMETSHERVVVLVDTDPWTVVGRNHLATDLLAHHGVENVMASHRDRFPTMTPEEIESHHLDVVVLLVDDVETADLAPVSAHFHRTPVRCLDRRILSHFGPTLLDAATLLERSFPRTTPSR
ncbi:helical backbone metal receptor [Nocardioides yefusunii]|uniref:Helical backbone metal receptor n=1 Tax=Nocardioides yefusunii TaxID=2500546 RepID=A0ABW1QYG5_9ACTN|nr:helical backbone metal receptor [Nocardioides yefusunii]